jgi:hypothetical protein
MVFGNRVLGMVFGNRVLGMVFGYRVLGMVFGPKRDDVTGEWRTLLSEELNYLYCSLNIIRGIKLRMRWAEHVACMGGRRGAYRFLMERL